MIRLIALAFLVACGSVSRSQHDAAAQDDAAIDSSPQDMPPDAAQRRSTSELVGGGARMTGATYTFEIQVGHSAQQSKIVGPTFRLEGNAAVKP